MGLTLYKYFSILFCTKYRKIIQGKMNMKIKKVSKSNLNGMIFNRLIPIRLPKKGITK